MKWYNERPFRLRMVSPGSIAVYGLSLAFAMAGWFMVHTDFRAIAAQLDHLVHLRVDDVSVRDGGLFSPGALIFHAERQSGGIVVQFEMPLRRDRATRMLVAMPDGTTAIAFMDPFTADLRGMESNAGPVGVVNRVLEAGLVEGIPRDWFLFWRVEQLCISSPEEMDMEGGIPRITVDDAIDAFARNGVPLPYVLTLPPDKLGAYSAHWVDHGGISRIVHVGPYDGSVMPRAVGESSPY